MPQVKKHKKKTGKTKVILVQADDISSEENREEEFDEGGMFLDKESIPTHLQCPSRIQTNGEGRTFAECATRGV
jgi:hypothetical protein